MVFFLLMLHHIDSINMFNHLYIPKGKFHLIVMYALNMMLDHFNNIMLRFFHLCLWKPIILLGDSVVLWLHNVILKNKFEMVLPLKFFWKNLRSIGNNYSFNVLPMKIYFSILFSLVIQYLIIVFLEYFECWVIHLL